MSNRPVLHYPNATLRDPASPVTTFGTRELNSLVNEMIATMRKLRGIGLAATQIGVDLQLAVIETKDGPLILANPKLAHMSAATENDEEGCLSLPMIYGVVPRAQSLTLRANDQQGAAYALEARGLLARVIQHEYDHLQGKLYIDRCTQLTTGAAKAASLGIRIGSS